MILVVDTITSFRYSINVIQESTNFQVCDKLFVPISANIS